MGDRRETGILEPDLDYWFPLSASPSMITRRTLPALLLLGLLFSSRLSAQERPFSFIAVGDAGQKGAVLNATARAMDSAALHQDVAGAPVSLLLFLGDNFYPIGLNRSESEVTDLIHAVLIEPHRALMSRLGPDNVHAVAGNHDYYCNMLGPAPYGICPEGNHSEDSIHEWSYHHAMPVRVRYAVAEGSRDSVEFILYDSALPIAIKPEYWHPGIDSLEKLLRSSAQDTSVKWRIMAAHHSPYTVGEHGGWRKWSKEENRVTYLGNCIEEGQDPTKYPQQFFSNQDNCDPQYKAWNDSLFALISRSGARIHLHLAGHDHSLQTFTFPDGMAKFGYPPVICDNCPKSYIISGAGSKQSHVRSSSENIYTHPLLDREGISEAGFIVAEVRSDRILITFINSTNGQPLEMGGALHFALRQDGILRPE